MNRHVGASFSLSVFIVGFFAVVLYQPDSGPPARPPDHPAKEVASPPESPSPIPPPTPGVPLVEASSGLPHEPPPAAPTPPIRHSPPLPPSTPERSTAPSPIALRPAAATRPKPRQRPSHPSPHPAFTQAGQGETLADVAVRVYGTPDAAQTLWLANRDLIDDRTGTLREGTPLRTP